MLYIYTFIKIFVCIQLHNDVFARCSKGRARSTIASGFGPRLLSVSSKSFHIRGFRLSSTGLKGIRARDHSLTCLVGRFCWSHMQVGSYEDCALCVEVRFCGVGRTPSGSEGGECRVNSGTFMRQTGPAVPLPLGVVSVFWRSDCLCGVFSMLWVSLGKLVSLGPLGLGECRLVTIPASKCDHYSHVLSIST